ncbi:hypothetical protein [Nocardiopsis sp. NPDC058789]|uniref:hypothetical protein n=1 Tax=Nocardiopsis sp. NPDC058789 TaxID=3346634 RepID=UPI00366ADBDD
MSDDTERQIDALHAELAIAVKARRRVEAYLEDAGRTNDELRQENGRILQIVADHIHRDTTYGGLDWDDLIEDLRRAGHTLPEPTAKEN